MQIIKDILLSNRMKSLYWRSSAMILVGVLNGFGDNLVGFHLTPEATVFVGLVLSEITKALNTSLK